MRVHRGGKRRSIKGTLSLSLTLYECVSAAK